MSEVEPLFPLEVVVQGSIEKSNFIEFKELAIKNLGEINTAPKTTEEFNEAKEQVKLLKSQEKSLTEGYDSIMSQLDGIQVLYKGVNELKDKIGKTRLTLEKCIKTQAETLKLSIHKEALDMIDRKDVRVFANRITNVMKGKRTEATLRSAAEGEAHIINAELSASREAIETFTKEFGDSSCPDKEQLELMSAKELNIELPRRAERMRSEEEKRKLKEAHEATMKQVEATKQASQPPQQPSPSRSGNHLDKRPPIGGKSVPMDQKPSVGTEYDNDSDREFGEAIKVFRQQFAPLKAVKENLVHPGNIRKFAEFSNKMNAAWKELNA